MSSYLLEADPFPFTAEQIRRSLGIKSSALDLLIEAGIASICLMSRKPVRLEVWAVTVDDDPARYGEPVSVSEPYSIPSDRRQVVRVEYAPDMLARVKARKNLMAWLRNQYDIGSLASTEARAVDAALEGVA